MPGLWSLKTGKMGQYETPPQKPPMVISPEANNGTRGPATMSQTELEKLVTDLAEMGRDGLVERLRSLDCGFHMDFTDDFLLSMPLHGLRHVVLAACLHQHRSPQVAGGLS